MAGLGRKVFTAGDVLTASDVQNYLMDQTVMNFAGTAARSSAIATPTTGMTTYIGTTGTATIPQIESYTGSGFQTLYGLTQVANVSFSAVSSVSIDSVFTSAFERYKIFVNFTSSVGSDANMKWKLRAGGSTNTTSNYRQQRIVAFSTTVVASENTSGTDNWTASLLTDNASDSYQSEMTIEAPQLARKTTAFNTISTKANVGTPYWEAHTLFFDATTQFDGINLSTAGTSFTGTIRIYGLRNS
jgi:hypothetical protein